MSKNYNNSLISKTIKTYCNGRLGVISGDPTNNITQTVNASTLYFTPIDGNAIGLYDTAANEWDLFTFDETSLSVSSLTADKNYDIFAYNNSGSIALDSTVWTNNSTRSVSLVRQDGILVRSNSLDRRYLGTIRTLSNGGVVTRDTKYSRYVWNYYNKRTLTLWSYIHGYHSYGTRVWRPYNGNSTIATNNGGRVDFVCGIENDAEGVCHFQTRYGYAGLGIDASSPPVNSLLIHDNAGYGYIGRGGGIRATSSYRSVLSAGYHFLQLCEHGVSGNSGFWYAEQTSFIEG